MENTILSIQTIKDHKRHAQKKFAKKTDAQKNRIIDQILDEISEFENDEYNSNIEEIEFRKIEAVTLAEMILRKL